MKRTILAAAAAAAALTLGGGVAHADNPAPAPAPAPGPGSGGSLADWPCGFSIGPINSPNFPLQGIPVPKFRRCDPAPPPAPGS
jgi:hypothetical protein